MISLDEFLTGEGWPKVDLVKMDVEGAEMDVLEGMGRLLQMSPDLRMVMEFNPALLHNASVEPSKLLVRVDELGFNVLVIDDAEGATPINEANTPSLTEALLKSESSVNLFCTKR
jgi:hypothetical protein